MVEESLQEVDSSSQTSSVGRERNRWGGGGARGGRSRKSSHSVWSSVQVEQLLCQIKDAHQWSLKASRGRYLCFGRSRRNEELVVGGQNCLPPLSRDPSSALAVRLSSSCIFPACPPQSDNGEKLIDVLDSGVVSVAKR